MSSVKMDILLSCVIYMLFKVEFQIDICRSNTVDAMKSVPVWGVLSVIGGFLYHLALGYFYTVGK